MHNTPCITLKMKWLLACLLVLLGAAQAFCTDVIINLSDPQFGVASTANRTVIVQAEQYQASSGWMLLPFRLTQVTSGSGSTTFSNLYGSSISGLYHCTIPGPPQLAQFDFWVSATNLGQITASSNLVTLGTQTYPAGAWAWSAQASDARYQFNGTVLSNTFYPLFSNPSNYFAGPIVSNTIGALAQTNQYIPGNNVTFTTNAGVVTVASVGAGAATNAISIINGSGGGTTLTNSTLLGSITATGLVAALPYVPMTNNVGNVNPAIFTNAASQYFANLFSGFTNYIVDAVGETSKIYQAAGAALNITPGGSANALMVNGHVTAQDFSGAGQNLTNIPFAQGFTSTNGYWVATVTAYGATNFVFVFTNAAASSITGLPTTNGLAGTAALNAATNQIVIDLGLSNTVYLTAITNSTNNTFVPINQGPFYNTNILNGTNFTSLFVWAGNTYTNSANVYLVITNNTSYWEMANTTVGFTVVTTNSSLSGLPVGLYYYFSGVPSPVFPINYQYLNLQPSAGTLTNFATTTTNVFANQTQLGNVSNLNQLMTIAASNQNYTLATYNTNQYIPGANVTLTTNSGIVTIASSGGGGSASNAISTNGLSSTGTGWTNTFIAPIITGGTITAGKPLNASGSLAITNAGSGIQAAFGGYVDPSLGPIGGSGGILGIYENSHTFSAWSLLLDVTGGGGGNYFNYGDGFELLNEASGYPARYYFTTNGWFEASTIWATNILRSESQINLRNLPYLAAANTNIIGTSGGAEGNDGTWIWNGLNQWTNPVAVAWNLSYAVGILTKYSNSTPYDSVPWTQLLTTNGAIIMGQIFGNTPAPLIWLGATNNLSGIVINGSPLYTGNPSFSSATIANAVISGLTASGQILFSNNAVEYFANPDGSTRATNVITGATITMTTNFNVLNTGTNTGIFVGNGNGLTNTSGTNVTAYPSTLVSAQQVTNMANALIGGSSWSIPKCDLRTAVFEYK